VQVLFYTLDTLPILLCFAFYALYHPGHLLPANNPDAVLDPEAAAQPAKQQKEHEQRGQQQNQQQGKQGKEEDASGSTSNDGSQFQVVAIDAV